MGFKGMDLYRGSGKDRLYDCDIILYGLDILLL